ncbi:MAG: ATP-binding protein, partial [Gemmatimonadota bacterium]|nr:ATP-binding protein [Gemmatimonadota bacterium]
QELARSNQDLQRFAYIASHDLQEPLRTVTNFVQLLDTRYADQLDDQAREFIGFAVDGTKRMQLLITDLLAYSRVQDSKTVRKELPLEEVVQDVMADLSNTIREVGATITYNDLPVVRGDATQLRQLLRNLVANALKFRGEAPPTIEIKGEDRIGEWMVSVTDNGIGIEKKFFERIFAVFQRLHTRDEYEGTGMGLALCKVVVERHGGRIWLDSQLGKGSTFHFTISKSPAVGNFVGGRFLGTPF